TLLGNFPLAGDFKVLNGYLLFDEYNTPVEFDSLYVANNARFWYLDSWGTIADDPDVLLLGTGDITLDGGILKIQTRETVIHELPNNILVTEKGGWLEVDRASGNPEKHFTGEITLRGNLRGSADAGSGDQLTIVGNITIENDLMIRGTEFTNNTFFVIKGDITGDYELLLNIESANTRIRLDGSTVTVGLLKIQSLPDESIRSAIQANAGTTINNDVEILEDSRFWIDSGNDSIFDTTRTITVHQDAEELRNNSAITLGALVYGATSLDAGTYTMAQVETFFGDPGIFTGAGSIVIGA
ncbi:MAG: hypothetical protein LAT55_13755, partial [Opitutales bacterium]|nr:hypothetical protein [Opitutales bacterium]